MAFKSQAFPLYICESAEQGFFNLAVAVNRAVIAELADGSGSDGRFAFVVSPPAYFKVASPQAVFMCLDNTRMDDPSALAEALHSFLHFARESAHVPLLISLDFDRRRRLYDRRWLRIQVTNSRTEYPWNLMRSILLLYADTSDEARAILQEITK